jgi:UDP-N-acetylglucosamine acyltransferase|tara:strand:- start:39377 stop:40156 length:780 start_codon:yes stop_codon:yes gene_type:complete
MSNLLSDISKQAKIAKNVQIDSFVTIQKNVVIEEGCWIGSNVTIMEGARIAKNCKIFPGAVISAIPQDLKFGGEDSLVEIGENTVIRECVTINRGTNYSGTTKIGKNCLIMAYVHIAHDCNIGDNVILVNSVQLGGHITIGDSAIIGGLSAIHQFVNVGKYCMISGGSLVRKDVPPFTKAAREPLSFVGINSIGLRRKGFEHKKIIEIQDIYRILYQSKLNTSQALNKLELEFPVSDERDEIINFINQSGRGLMKGYKQ